jgi:cardiolipin synthase
MNMKTLPNLLTAFRICVVPLLVLAMFIPVDVARWFSLFLFSLAAITDFFDGYLARKYDSQSDLGTLLDPIADKFLVLASLLMLIAIGTLSGFNVVAAIIILGREILVAGLREFLASSSIKLPVTQLAKWKTTIQMIAIGFLIAGPAGATLIPGSVMIGIVGIWAAAIITVITGYQYVAQGLLKMNTSASPQETTDPAAQAVSPDGADEA